MPNLNNDVIAEYVDVRRALMHANHTQSRKGAVDRTLAELERYLSRPMRVVVLGEHNCGKTTLINAILGRKLLPTAVIANTPVSVTMRYGSIATIRAQMECGTWYEIDRFSSMDGLKGRGLRSVEISAPHPLLKRFELVDTPATEDPRACIQGADFVVWCTNAAQAWSETERRTWMSLPRRCRRLGVLVASHCDVLDQVEDREKVMQRLQDLAGELFEEIHLVNGVADAVRHGSVERPGGGVYEVMRSLVAMSQAQRVRRGQAAERIARRLNRSSLTVKQAHTTPRFMTEAGSALVS